MLGWPGIRRPPINPSSRAARTSDRPGSSTPSASFRIGFAQLEPAARRAVDERCGPIHSVRDLDAGMNSAIAAILETDAGPVFLKALPTGRPSVLRGQHREAFINPHVRGLSPRLLWHEVVHGWSLLGFDALPDPRRADYGPGSADLPRLAAAIDTLAALPCPDEGVLSVERRFAGYLDDPCEAARFAGDTLLHTDYNPQNIILSGGRLWMVDWAWASRGAAFIDPACALPWLITAGHSAAQAEAWAQSTSGWDRADPAAIDLFATAIQRIWREIATHNPGSRWQADLADAAETWSTYRAQRNPR
jgi:hypothetical protein